MFVGVCINVFLIYAAASNVKQVSVVVKSYFLKPILDFYSSRP